MKLLVVVTNPEETNAKVGHLVLVSGLDQFKGDLWLWDAIDA